MSQANAVDPTSFEGSLFSRLHVTCEVSEIVGRSYRVLAATVIQLYWAVAYMTLACIAYLLRDRFTLQISISAPLALLLLLYG